MAYKLEDFVYALETCLKADLNGYLNAINTEKGDTLLSEFAPESYFVQTLDERVANYKEFLVIQVGNPSLDQSVRGAMVATYPVSVYMAFDSGNSDVGAKRLYRYLDALQECLLKSFWKVSLKPFKFRTLDQMALIDIDKSKRVVATGVTLEVSIALV